MKTLYKTAVVLGLAALSQGLTGCSEPDSELVAFADDNQISTPNDTVYSLLGIINKLQVVADRTVLLGELRGDLTALTDQATLDLQAVANFTAGTDNPYNNARDYYAIIQNCNYFLSNANTDLVIRGRRVFEKEYAVVKTYRAWTYLQLAINYGAVPFVTEPLLAEKDADPALYPLYDVRQIADYFINDLQPYLDTETPDYGGMGGEESKNFYYPTRVLMADLCLWAGRYREAAQHYHDYLTLEANPRPTHVASTAWTDQDFTNWQGAFSSSVQNEVITFIPMESEEYDGIVSYLDDVFNSTADNDYYYQATHSLGYDELSQAQHYTLVYNDPVTQLPDTVSPDYDALNTPQSLRGDLRQQETYQLRSFTSASANQSSLYQTCYKHRSSHVNLLRTQHIYLRYAEALNRAGFPEAAFFVLKRGLCPDNITGTGGIAYLSEAERAAAGPLIDFNAYVFTRQNTQGLHSRGSGRADADKTYDIPALPAKADSILWVENAICDEMALETAAEGLRYYDLMRLSLHRDDPTFLADHVARRNGAAQFDAALFARLSDQRNWYLPLE